MKGNDMTEGIPASSLSDEDLRHELAQLDRTRKHIQSTGTEHQQKNHEARTAELRGEVRQRFGADDPSAAT